jgi:holliday junction DNA helicase RuvA
MLDSLRGRILATDPELLLEVGPVTFRVEISDRTRSALPGLEAEVMIFTELVVREDHLGLLGFARPEERSLYRRVTAVSGVGKRLALAILSELSPEELARCVSSEDEKRLTRVSGIGKKTASRLLLELQGHLEEFLPDPRTSGDPVPADERPEREEALLALGALGMNPASARRALEAVGDESLPVEELVRRALTASSEGR